MTSKTRRVGARQGLSAKKTVQEKLTDLRSGNSGVVGTPTKKTGGVAQRPASTPSTPSTPVDCGGWGGFSNPSTNNRGGRRGR